MEDNVVYIITNKFISPTEICSFSYYKDKDFALNRAKELSKFHKTEYMIQILYYAHGE